MQKTALNHVKPNLVCFRKLNPCNQDFVFFIYEKAVI